LPSSRRQPDARRKTFLKLSGQIEGQLREAYDKKFRAGQLTQSSLGAKLGVNRSAIHHRLSGGTNMTIETIADMIWGLGHDFEFKLFDPVEAPSNHQLLEDAAPIPQKKSEPIPAELDPTLKQFLDSIVNKQSPAPAPVS
jgi:hypothetical protein